MPKFPYLMVLSVLSLCLVTALGWFTAFLITLVLAFSFGFSHLSISETRSQDVSNMLPVSLPENVPVPSTSLASSSEAHASGHPGPIFPGLPMDPICLDWSAGGSASMPNSLDAFLACGRYRTWTIPGPHPGTFYIEGEYEKIPAEPLTDAGIIGQYQDFTPLNESNAGLRNHQYEAECRAQLQNHQAREQREMWRSVMTGDYVLQDSATPYRQLSEWVELSGDDLLAMSEPPHLIMQGLFHEKHAYSADAPNPATLRESMARSGSDFDLRWWGLLHAAFSSADGGIAACRLYYPQLFYGYWISFPDLGQPVTNE